MPETDHDTDELVEVAGYHVHLPAADRAEDAASTAAIRLDVAADAVRAALQPVAAATVWRSPSWRFAEFIDSPLPLLCRPPLATATPRRLERATEQLLQLLADLDAATAAMRRLVEDIDADRMAAVAALAVERAR